MALLETAKRLIKEAQAEGRKVLLEHEVYELLEAGGLGTPRRLMVTGAMDLDPFQVEGLSGDKVIIKMISPEVTHKTEMGGVAVCPRNASAVMARLTEMENAILQRGGPAIAESVQGYLICEMVKSESGLGSEVFVGLRNTREFGPCLLAGFGGVDTEALAAHFRQGRALCSMPLGCGTPEDFLESFRKTFAYTKIAGLGRGATRRLEDTTLLKVFRCFFELGLGLMALDSDEPCLLDLEINPFLLSAGNLVAVDGFARFGEGFKSRHKVPAQGIGHLLKPQTAAVIGVSAREINVGRTILRNLLSDGFPSDSIRVIRPGGGQIDGVACVDSISALPWVADLLVLAVSAVQAPGVVEECLDSGKTRSLILIPGGMDETEGGKEVASRIRKRLAEARASGGPAPVMVGPNCLGIRSRPGHYDTLFIPQVKFPPPEKGSPRNLALVLQSGGFLLTRLSKLPLLDSVYAISTGNQMDLCTTDFIPWISANASEVAVLGLYIEGYKDGEGLDAFHAVRRAVVSGKTVVVYKAGRTREGKSATSSHTASMAGDYETAVEAMRRAGAIVADTFEDFGGLLMLASLLAGKKIGGRRLGVISNAGFETVGISDSVDSASGFSLGRFSAPTSESLRALLEANGLSALVNLKNPLDLTPMAGDGAYFDSLTALMDDPALDSVVLGLVPFSWVVATLPEGLKADDSVNLPSSLPSRLAQYYGACEKPLVTVVDAGPLYDALAAALLRARVPVFRSCDQAMRCLQKYLESRIQNGR